jgi:hypothetical protein
MSSVHLPAASLPTTQITDVEREVGEIMTNPDEWLDSTLAILDSRRAGHPLG